MILTTEQLEDLKEVHRNVMSNDLTLFDERKLGRTNVDAMIDRVDVLNTGDASMYARFGQCAYLQIQKDVLIACLWDRIYDGDRRSNAIFNAYIQYLTEMERYSIVTDDGEFPIEPMGSYLGFMLLKTYYRRTRENVKATREGRQ